MFKEKINFYSPINLKAYNLDKMLSYQLNVLQRMDPFTRKHSENVANLCGRICEYLKCTPSFTTYCIIGSYLHDIGKIFISPKILNKPSRLTEEEFEIMKTHTTLGYKMCMKNKKLRPYALIALNHHESLDGSGYPNGLKKKDIPYEVQIIRIADEYDAIVTKRQYETHINISEVLKELIKDAQPNRKILALYNLSEKKKYGKINGFILKRLFKVVIDDTLYEISGVINYMKYLKEQIRRLNLIQTYQKKADVSNKEKTKEYYKEGMRLLFKNKENFDNYLQVLKEYETALDKEKDRVKNLYKEIKIIKKLKV